MGLRTPHSVLHAGQPDKPAHWHVLLVVAYKYDARSGHSCYVYEGLARDTRAALGDVVNVALQYSGSASSLRSLWRLSQPCKPVRCTLVNAPPTSQCIFDTCLVESALPKQYLDCRDARPHA